MTHLWFGSRSFDADLVVFDKDGTLVDFEYMWGHITEAWFSRLVDDLQKNKLRSDLAHALGYDWHNHRTRSQSPLAIATTGQVQTLIAGVLYQNGLDWLQAESLSKSCFEQVMQELPLPTLIKPIGQVADLFTQLRACGVHTALITTDHRSETEETLRILGITPLIEQIFCGDDGLPIKPAPDTLLLTCQQLGVTLDRAVMIGDTEADLRMGHNAGVGLVVGVLTGAGDPTLLQELADLVIPSIEHMSISESTLSN